MRAAARLALRGAGRASPNPIVGCLIVDPASSRILGSGYHRAFGSPHAEAHALADCAHRGNSPKGAVAYVTLEPCSHVGKTPSCADALIAAGISRVLYARADPNPIAGRGAERLRAAGIAADLLPVPEAVALSDPFCKRITTRLPWTIVKWAQSLDGRIAPPPAQRTELTRWISSPASRAAVHRIRARVDAILTGMGTALADDPLLTARTARRIHKRALRVVADPRLSLPLTSVLARTAPETPLLLLTTHSSIDSAPPDRLASLRSLNITLAPCAPAPPDSPASVSAFLRAGLTFLYESHHVGSLLVEAGPGLTTDLFRASLVDELIVYLAQRIIADDSAPPPLRSLSPPPRLDLRRVRPHGPDLEPSYRILPAAP